MSDPALPTSSESFTRRPRRQVAFVALTGAVVLSLLAASAWLLQNNAVAQMLLGLIVAILTTGASVYATHWYAREQRRDELTRYGLLAFRNLESLAAKMTSSIGADPPDEVTVRGWLLDVDLGRWAWRDLLREVFKLQERLQADADELARKSLVRLASVEKPEDRTTIEAEHRVQLAELAIRAPLPLEVPVEVKCPMCELSVQTRLGQQPGEGAHSVCPNCGTTFPIHRLQDGSVKVGNLTGKAVAEIPCPACGASEIRLLPTSRSVEFVFNCKNCGTHVKVRGPAGDLKVSDEKKYNVTFKCPVCEGQSSAWISPNRSVYFLTKCTECSAPVSIRGTHRSFSATPATANSEQPLSDA